MKKITYGEAIIDLMAFGATDAEIASCLDMTEPEVNNTWENYVHAFRRKKKPGQGNKARPHKKKKYWNPSRLRPESLVGLEMVVTRLEKHLDGTQPIAED